MEKPTFTAIDYNSLENKVIEGLVRDNYSKIKNTFYKVFNKRVKNPNSPVGLCADLIEASNYKDDPDRILWRKVIKSWFTPQRFNLTYVYFGYSTPLIQHLKEEVLDINGRVWFKVSLEKLKNHEYLLETAFWFPVSKEYNAERIKILECALEDLERIKREGEPKLLPLTFEEPKINIPMMEDLAKLTKEEEEILMLTEEIWNKFLQLPINHPMEMDEMAIKIHDIQRMIISRPGFRLNQEMFNQYGKGNSDKG